jgi:hypothetical protein
MPPVRSLKNQYRGINAHLHSKWQQHGNWAGFHTRHIGDLAGLLRAQLHPMGYVAEIEESLQVRRTGDPTWNPRADVLILDDGSTLRVVETERRRSYSSTQDMVVTIPEALAFNEVDYYKAIAIYRSQSDQGEPVAWIELLSPSNKPGGWDWHEYGSKRERLVQSGLVFVEIDYLSQTPPTLDVAPDGFPFRITVIDPHPNLREGQARIRSFHVDDPLPVIAIPLFGNDVLEFDFGAAYDKTFNEMLYGNEVDYSQFPLNFERYTETDQARIANRMLAVLKAAQQDTSLQGFISSPQEPLPLAQALVEIETLRLT